MLTSDDLASSVSTYCQESANTNMMCFLGNHVYLFCVGVSEREGLLVGVVNL